MRKGSFTFSAFRHMNIGPQTISCSHSLSGSKNSGGDRRERDAQVPFVDLAFSFSLFPQILEHSRSKF